MIENQISLTNSAVTHLKRTLQNKSDVVGVRLGVKNAGCSGLSYILDFAKTIQAEDRVFETEGVKVIVDAKSLEYLKGTEIDCVQEGLNEQLKFNNPNVKNACGCGESFNI